MGYISLPSILSATIDITSYYYVILKMVILHDATETIRNGVFVFFLKKEQTCFFKKNGFFSTMLQMAAGISSQLGRS